jgi:arylsulfatase/arylsulfatase A
MISNIDDNVGRLFEWLDRRKLTERTLVIFMTDNGEATPGYNAGFRGRKADVYEGGVRSPFFAHWPGKLLPGVASDTVAAHIDVLPTILDACGVEPPPAVKLDGRSVWPLLRREPVKFKERALFIQSHRGDAPVLYHNFAVRTERWKLVHNSGFGREQLPNQPLKLELFDMANDPFETHDVAAEHADVVNQLKRSYEWWFADVSGTRPDNYAPPRIQIGTPHEDPVVLTRQDWRGAGWGPKDRGHWEVQVAEAGEYDVKILFRPVPSAASVTLRVGDFHAEQTVDGSTREVTFSKLKLPAGTTRLDAAIGNANESVGVTFVELSRRR